VKESHGAFRALYTDPVTINGTPMSLGTFGPEAKGR